MPKSQTLIMLAGIALMFLGGFMYWQFPLDPANCQTVEMEKLKSCVSSPGTICLGVGAALLVIGYLGMAYMDKKVG